MNTSSVSQANNAWTLDHIIQRFFPYIGIMMIAGGLGYFLYTGFWDQVQKPGRLALGFLAGIVMIIGGYSFQEKLKKFSDVIIGGGILMMYVTLIYGSRFDFAININDQVFPESFALIVSALFAGGISFYAAERKSSAILIVGMMGAYATPFFIGQTGGFEYGISYLQFLLYFLAVNIALMMSSFKLNLFALMGANTLGLFIGTLTISGVIGDGMAEYPVLIPVIAFAIMAVQLIFITLNVEKLQDKKIISSLYFITPFIWITTILFGALDPNYTLLISELSLTGVIMLGVSALYFFIWRRLDATSIFSQFFHGVIYLLGFAALGLAVLDIAEIFGGYMGIFLSGISIIFAMLHISSAKISRELAFLGTAAVGAFLTITHSQDSSQTLWIFSKDVLLTCISLVPFLFHFIMKQTNNTVFDLRKALAYFSAVLIALLLGLDIFEDLNLRLDFLFLTLPAGVLACMAFATKKSEKITQYLPLSLGLLGAGYFVTFFSFWDKLFPSHSDLPFSSFEGAIGLISLGIALLITTIVKRSKNFSSGFEFMAVAFTVLVAFQFISYELIAVYNVFVEPITPTYQGEDTAVFAGLRATIISFWWVILSSFLIFLGIRDGSKFPQEKRIGMALLAFTFGKIFLYDIAHLDTNLKVLLFMITGGIILGLSYALHKKKGETL